MVNGAAVQAFRKARRLTVTAAAQAAGIKQPHLSLIESGKRNPSDEVAMRLAWVLGLEDLRAILANPGPEWIPVVQPEVAA